MINIKLTWTNPSNILWRTWALRFIIFTSPSVESTNCPFVIGFTNWFRNSLLVPSKFGFTNWTMQWSEMKSHWKKTWKRGQNFFRYNKYLNSRIKSRIQKLISNPLLFISQSNQTKWEEKIQEFWKLVGLFTHSSGYEGRAKGRIDI